MKQRTFGLLLGLSALVGTSIGVQAQTIYRIVGPDGKISFSDKPPANPEQGKITGTGAGARADTGGANSALPYELRQVVNKYPVVLYTAAKCSPCDTGRAMLTARGVPFNERTVSTPEDQEALKRIAGDNGLPVLAVGGQKLKGMSDSEWNQTLDAAGYPKSSALPSGYKNPAPTPLVTVQKPAAPKPEEPAAPEAAPAPTQPNPTNPRGIIF